MPPESEQETSGIKIAGGFGGPEGVEAENRRPSPTTDAPHSSSPVSSEIYKSASDIAADAAASSVLGKLASLLSCSRMGGGGAGDRSKRTTQNANDLQTAQLKKALSDLIADNGTDDTSLTIPSMSTQTTASSIVHSQRHSDTLQNLGPQETTAFKLSTPLQGHGSGAIAELPAQLRDNIGATLSGLVDSRVKSSISVLVKQMINLGSLDEAKALAQIAQNPSATSINAIVTTFRLANKRAEPPASHPDGTKTWNLPLIFEVVADISIHNNKTSTLMITSSGSITGTFDTTAAAATAATTRTSDSISTQDDNAKSSSFSYLLKDATVTVDAVALLTAMVTQARKAAKVAVRHLAEIIGSAAAKERENEKKRAAAVEAYKQRQQQEEEEKRLFQLLQQHSQMQPMQQQQEQQQPPMSDLIDLNQLHNILSQSGSSASSTANMASLASVASLINGPYGKSDHNLKKGGGLLSGQSRGNLLQSGTKNQSFFPISNNNSNSHKPFVAAESLSNLQPLPFIGTDNFNQQNNHQMQQINGNMPNNLNNLNQLFPTLPTSHQPQNQRRMSQEEMEETRKMIDSNEGLPSSLAQVAAELRVETEAANKKRRAKRRRSSAESNATADSSSSYQFSLDTITNGCSEGEAQPLTLSTLFAKQDEMFEEERRKRSAAEALVGCNQNNSTDGGTVQGSGTLLPTTSGISTSTQDQLLALLKRSGADAATTEAAANLLFQGPAKDQYPQQAQMNMQLAAANINAGVNTNAAVSQALQASAPSMLSLLSPDGKTGTDSDFANFAASFVSGNFPHSFSSLSASSLWDNRKRSARSLSGEINVIEGNLKKKVSFNMVNETFTSL